MKRLQRGILRLRNSPTGAFIQNGRPADEITADKITLDVAQHSFLADFFLIFFYEIMFFFTYFLYFQHDKFNKRLQANSQRVRIFVKIMLI